MDETTLRFVQLGLYLVMIAAYVATLGIAWQAGVSKGGIALALIVTCVPVIHWVALIGVRLAVRTKEDQLERGPPAEAARLAVHVRRMNVSFLVFAIALVLLALTALPHLLATLSA